MEGTTSDGKSLISGIRQAWTEILASSHTSCVILAGYLKSLKISFSICKIFNSLG